MWATCTRKMFIFCETPAQRARARESPPLVPVTTLRVTGLHRCGTVSTLVTPIKFSTRHDYWDFAPGIKRLAHHAAPLVRPQTSACPPSAFVRPVFIRKSHDSTFSNFTSCPLQQSHFGMSLGLNSRSSIFCLSLSSRSRK